MLDILQKKHPGISKKEGTGIINLISKRLGEERAKSIIKSLEEEELREYVFGLIMNEEGEYLRMVRKRQLKEMDNPAGKKPHTKK